MAYIPMRRSNYNDYDTGYGEDYRRSSQYRNNEYLNPRSRSQAVNWTGGHVNQAYGRSVIRNYNYYPGQGEYHTDLEGNNYIDPGIYTSPRSSLRSYSYSTMGYGNQNRDYDRDSRDYGWFGITDEW